MNENYKDIEKLLTHYPNKMITGMPAPAVIVCTGGGYEMLGTSEGPPASANFANSGYETFLLNYSVGRENPFPTAMRELAYAVRYIRENAEELNVIPDKVYVCGFSAGGHLAMSLGVHWNSDWIEKYDIPKDAGPDKIIVAYPVIGETCGNAAITFTNLSANLDDPQIKPYMYLDKYINKDMPPVFVWHNQDDMIVPVESTIDFTKTLNEKGIQFESHIFPNGGHANPFSNQYWFYMALDWLAMDY